MTAQEFKEKLTISDIINYVTIALGSDGYKEDNNGNPIFQTVDHNKRGQGKYKLYYYNAKKIFVSYTGDGTMDIYELTQRAGYALDFRSSYEFVLNFFGYSTFAEDAPVEKELTGDWDLLNKFDLINQPEKERPELPKYSPALMEYFPNALPYYWLAEGITPEVMVKYGIRMDTINEKIVIPHHDIHGNLVGIRGRAYNWFDLENGAKYMPIFIGDTCYNHPLGENLYGIYQNAETIRRTKKCVIFESEKSVLQSASYYGNNNYTVAVCGSSISETQVSLLLSLGIEEVVIAFDRENDEFPLSEATSKYREKICGLASMFSPYVNTYYIMDTFGKLRFKDSPSDRGKDTLEFLLNKKIPAPTFSVGIAKKGRKR